MYGSWYCGSQASSWIFWWAFARLCRLTSTPSACGRGLGRCCGPSVRRRRCGGRGLVPPSRGGAGVVTPEGREGGGAAPSPRGRDHTGCPDSQWSQYETFAGSCLPRVDLPRVGRLLREPGGEAVVVSKQSASPSLTLGRGLQPNPDGGPAVARARTAFLV